MSADLSLCYLTATEALARFRARTLSPVDLVGALIARGEAVQPKLNAFTDSFPERALEQARAAEARYVGKGPKPRPLEGLPIGLKDGHDVAGEITTYGSRLYADHRPETSELHIDRILRAGAILLARTTTPEFGAATICHSDLWGITRNPWDRTLSPAGSGGGAGAALAAGMITLADGSDFGGSIRNPASACGVVGFKPPFGRVPKQAPWNFNTWSSFGSLARSVADVALLQNVIAGQHPADLTSLPGKKRIPADLAPIDGWRIAVSPDLGFFEIDPGVAANLRAAQEVFADMGCAVESVDTGWTDRVFEAALSYYQAYDLTDPDDRTPERQALLTDYVRRDADYFAGKTLMTPAEAATYRGKMYDALAAIFRRCRVLICPTLALPAVPADLHPIDGEVRINGKRVDPALGWVLCYPFNMLGQLPVISIPSGFAANGVPTGIQIIGRPFDDVSVFRAAAAFERARPWLHQAAARPAL